MSDTEIMPPPDALVDNCGAGFIRYRMAFTSIRVDPARDDGRRLEVFEDGRRIIFNLSADQAKHLAGLLFTEPLTCSPHQEEPVGGA